jgi:uncharacterized membrane protein
MVSNRGTLVTNGYQGGEMTTEFRIQQLELGYEELWERVAQLEQQTPAQQRPTPAQQRPTPAPRPEPAEPIGVPTPGDRPAGRESRRQTGLNFEDLLGGRILALIGAVAVVLSGAFFLALAVSNGWIGEAARTLMAAASSGALLAFGMWLHERKDRTYAALSITGAALACLFLTVMVASVVYDLIPAFTGLALAMLVGACGTLLAVRWAAVPIGAIGIVGALLAPVLAGAPQTGTTLALLFVANLAAVGVLIWQRWDWLGFATFVVAGPQWVQWAFDSGSAAGSLLTLLAFGGLGVGAAIGFELRVPAARLRPSSAFLLALNAITLAGAGWLALTAHGDRALAESWLCFLAVAHLGVGIAGSRLERISEEIALLVLVIGVVLADIAFSLLLSGPAVAIGFAAASVTFAWLLRRQQEGELAETLVSIGLGGHLVLALGHMLAVDAPPAALTGEPLALTTAVLVLGVLVGALGTSARLVSERYGKWRLALDGLALAVGAYTAVLVFDGAMLVGVLALAAVVLAQLARRTGDELAEVASVSFLGAAMFHALALEAPPQALFYGVGSLTGAIVAVGACGVAALACAHQKVGDRTWQLMLLCGGAVSLLYLASVGVVTAFQPGGAETTVLDLPVRQQGQVLMSALWGVAGLCALLTGLRRDLREVRLAGLALLMLTVGKVFLYDLAALESVYRVLSFLALGALLLAASFAYQRLRPAPLPDLRETARALR